MMRRLWLTVAVLAAVAALAIVSFASATQQVGSGTATITGSGTNWNLTIANTGSEAIKCWRYTFPPGIQATGIKTPPAGWQVGGNKPPPAPILGGRGDAGIAPNGKATFGFTTTRAFDTGRRLAGLALDPPGIAAGSTDCISDFNMPVDYGSTPPPPKPKPRCKCKSLKITDTTISRFPFDLAINLSWSLACTPAGGGKCEGKIRVVAPTKKFAIRMVPKDGTVFCKGTCKALNDGKSTVRMDFGAPFSDKGETFRFKLRKFCKRGLVFVPAGTQTTTIAFDEDGKLDRVQSDLNANGKPDGDEKKG